MAPGGRAAGGAGSRGKTRNRGGSPGGRRGGGWERRRHRLRHGGSGGRQGIDGGDRGRGRRRHGGRRAGAEPEHLLVERLVGAQVVVGERIPAGDVVDRPVVPERLVETGGLRHLEVRQIRLGGHRLAEDPLGLRDIHAGGIRGAVQPGVDVLVLRVAAGSGLAEGQQVSDTQTAPHGRQVVVGGRGEPLEAQELSEAAVEALVVLGLLLPKVLPLGAGGEGGQERGEDVALEELRLDLGDQIRADLVAVGAAQERAQGPFRLADPLLLDLELPDQLIGLPDVARSLVLGIEPQAAARRLGRVADRLDHPEEIDRAEDQQHEGEGAEGAGEAVHDPAEGLVLLHRGAGARDQPLLGEQLLFVEVADEEGPRLVEDLLEVLEHPLRIAHLHAQQVAAGDGDRPPLLDAAGQVEAAEEERLLVAAGGEDGVEVVGERLLERLELLGEDEQLVGELHVLLVLEEAHPLLVGAVHDLVEDAGEALEVPGLLGGTRVRPAEELALLGRVELREELGEAEDAVGLGDQDEDREADLQHLLEVEQLLADVLGLALLLVGRVLDQAGRRDHHDGAVDRAVLAVLPQQLEEGRPLLLVGGALLLEGEAAGGVEDHRLVREPPVAVAGAAGAGEGVGAHRELEPRVLERRALARLRLADQQVPGEGVDRHPRLAQLGDRGLPLLGELGERLADLLLAHLGLAGVEPEAPLELAGLLLLAAMAQGFDQPVEEAEAEHHHGGDPRPLTQAEHAAGGVGEGGEGEEGDQPAGRPRDRPQQRHQLVHTAAPCPEKESTMACRSWTAPVHSP